MKNTKIAILGAGLSGLCCAFQLEKHGVKADIFERRREVEDRFINGEGMMDILTRPIKDSFSYLADQFDLHLQPLHPISKLTMVSEHNQVDFSGHFGFITVRGRHPQALSKQVAKKIKSKIYFNSKKTYDDLLKEYDTILMATGDGRDVRNIQPFNTDVSVKILGFTLKGEFNPGQVKIFLNNDLSPKGYVYLLPYDEENANIAIATPVNHADMSILKERLLQFIDISSKITDEFKIEDYIIGRPEKSRIGNTYFIGNCGGNIFPFMGFGQFGAMLSGLLAADSIIYNIDFDEQIQFLRKSYGRSLILRRFMEEMDNENFDKMVKVLQGKVGERLFHSNKINPLKAASYLMYPYVKGRKSL
jgi:flavin-dependent dehydrogenase